MYVIRDSKGKVFKRVKRPTVVFDKDTFVLYKIGEYEDIEEYYNISYEAYTSHGFIDMANALVLMELPKEQDEIDNVFQNTGYIKRLYERVDKG